MPELPSNIPEFTNPIDRITPSDRGIQGAELAGRRIGSFYHQIGEDVGGAVTTLGDQWQQHQDQQALVHYTTQSAQHDANYELTNNQYFNTPDPDHPGHTMGERPDAAIQRYQDWKTSNDQLVEQATKNMTPAMAARVQEHAAEREATTQKNYLADQVSLDKATSVRNTNSIISSAAAQVYANPANFDAALQNFQDNLDAAYGPAKNSNFAGATEEQARVEKSATGGIVKAAVMGYVNAGQYDAAKAFLDNPKYDSVFGEDRPELEGYLAKQQEEHQAQVDAKMRFDHEQAGWQSQDTAGKAMDDALQGKPWSSIKLAQAGLRPEDSRGVFDFNRKIAEPDPVQEEGYFKEGYAAVMAAAAAGKPMDTAAIIRHMGGAGQSGYSPEQAHILMELNKDVTGKTLTPADRLLQKGATDSIRAELHSSAFTAGATRVDAAGDAAYEAALQHYLPLAIAAKANGVPTANIWDRTGKAEGSVFAASPWNPAQWKSVGSQVTSSRPLSTNGPAKPMSMDEQRAAARKIAGLQ